MIRFYCGCGWTHPASHSDGFKNAIEHVVQTGHIVGGNGYIRPEDVGVERRRPSTPIGRKSWTKEGGDRE